MIKNKKAGERVLSIYLFIIYIIVAIGIVSGVLLVYGSGLDVREAEAGILSDRVIDCLTEQGVLNESVFDKNFNLLEFCNFDFSEEEYGVGIELSDFNSGEKLKENMDFGRNDFLEFCGLKGDKIPKCSEKEVYVLREEELSKEQDFSEGLFVTDPDSVSTEQNSEDSLKQEKIILKVIGAVGKVKKNV